MNNLKKYLFRALLITIGCLFQFSLLAQTTYGIIPFSGGGTCINSDGTSTNTYQIELPGTAPFSSFNNKSFSVSGGIEIASLDTLYGRITIKSLTSDNRKLGYPKYRPGTITFSCEAPEDSLCMACPYYDPHFVYHYTVYKLFDLTKTLNPVVGPICVLEGDTVTYSVEPWVSTGTGATGADNYRWELPTSLVDTILYYSADSSSITFVIDQLTGADTIKTQIGRCNIGDPAKYTWLALNQSAPTPIINDTSCVAGGIHEVQFWVENAQAGLTYTWSCNQPTWLFKNGVITGDTVTVIVDDKNPATLKVEAAYSGGGCDPSESTRFITRAISSSVSTISPNNNCFASNANEVTFTLKDYPSGSKFTWTIPAGWTDNNDSLATCKTQPSASAHLYDSILVAVKGCESSVAKAYVYVKPGDANPITGTTFCIEKDSTYSFSTTATSPAADTYEWDLGSWKVDTTSLANSVIFYTNTNSNTITLTAINTCETKTFKYTISCCN